jgi:hypothetical protein
MMATLPAPALVAVGYDHAPPSIEERVFQLYRS